MNEAGGSAPNLHRRKLASGSLDLAQSVVLSNPGSSLSKSSHPRRKRRKFNIAPLNTPLRQRVQTLALIWHTICIPVLSCVALATVGLGRTAWLTLVLPYLVWFYGFDLHTPTNGKVVYRVRDWMRNLIIWEWFVEYFPISVHMTCELEPTFTQEVVERIDSPDDEEDLVLEYSRTFADRLFKMIGLKKRVNDADHLAPNDDVDDLKSNNSSSNSSLRELPDYPDGNVSRIVRKVQTGPRYIFGYHPHGVISMGVMGLFATNALRNEPFEPPARFLLPLFHKPCKNSRPFPGIGYIFPLTLTQQFTVPLYRDYILSLGLTSASAKNIKSIINNGDNSVCVVVGGAEESLLNDRVGRTRKVGIGYKGPVSDDETDSNKSSAEDNSGARDGGNSQSGHHHAADASKQEPRKQIRLVLRKRKGFVKLAIELGNVSLVPIFAFGEADIYTLNTPQEGLWGWQFQRWMKSTFQFTIPFFSARGVFVYDFGFLPYRTPIDIVTGNPIYVPPGLLQNSEKLGDASPELKPLRKRQPSLTNLLLGTKKAKKARPAIPQDILDHYHRLYVEELKRVYEDNKDRFGYGDVELIIHE